MNELVFLNHTKITDASNKQLNKVMFILKILPIVIIYEIIALLIICYGLVIKNYLITIIFGIIFIVFPVMMILILKYRTKSIYKKYREIYDNSVYTYYFYQDRFKVELTYKSNKSASEFRYQDIKIVETDNLIFLFVSNSGAYIVDINGFEENFDRLGFTSSVIDHVKKYQKI